MLRKLMWKFQRFMVGRNGIDQLGTHILWFCIGLNLISMFFRGLPSTVIFVVVDALLIFQLYRTFSKNLVKRGIENRKYCEFLTKFKRTWKVLRLNLTDKTYHYFLCPDCAQMVRVPKGRGKVEIHCPNCGSTFERKA